ncbi:MAG TPA: carbohydrate ABC transporter permease [Spirochaetia bacterium]|nr:carbohydrate ABC transporter permease [Spirochaetia bacterium]
MRRIERITQKTKKTAISILAWVALSLAIVWSMFPILFIFSSSLKEAKTIFAYPPSLVEKPTLKHYFSLYKEWPEFYDSIGNSLIITLSSVVFTLLICLPAAYGFSRYRSRFIRFTGRFLIWARMFPPIIITIPLYPIVYTLGLMDSHVVLILLYSAFYLSIVAWILKSFLDNIPPELEESAYIEGCSQMRSFMMITLPLSTPGMVSGSILVAIFCWKEFFFAFLFTTLNAKTSPVVLKEMLGSMFGVTWGPLFAATSLQLLPILIFIFLVQRFLFAGLAHSGDK